MHLQTLEFWPISFQTLYLLSHPSKHWNSYTLPNIDLELLLSYSCLTFEFWFCPLIETLLFSSYPPEHWNSRPVLIIIQNLIFSFQTLEFFSYPFKHWNSDCILLNIWILILLFESLEFLSYSSNSQEFLSYLSKHWNSCLIFPNIWILINVYKYAVPTFLTCSQWLNSGGTREVRSDVSM